MWEVQCELAVTMSVQESFKCPRDPKALLASKNGVRQVTACAVAARVMGYPSFAEVILEQQLSPRAVAVMLRQSATKDGASPRRHRAGRWHGSTPGRP